MIELLKQVTPEINQSRGRIDRDQNKCRQDPKRVFICRTVCSSFAAYTAPQFTTPLDPYTDSP
ncbi:hypothetical protein GCM10007939_18710 [Amylibacter marinus]|uniref:Uncharacterized protein n=1 Tax=Amylibacter marinus TaxID=1475483 RepID=A0ABQ5VVX1_9RHOB|nr:hypothetical protein GCM10007939_18710 [Amylibacter marinus]